MTPRRTRLALAFASLAALSTGACASERAPINRVQANALDKKFFVGPSLADLADDPEFYYRATVADVDYGAAQNGLFTASYAQAVARMKWEITEDLLIGRLTYERITDSTGNGSADDNAGQIVTAFAIQSHFDIRRAYNPQTGEELNIIEENTSDRPWYERDYMRVDWSQNLITGAYELDTVSALKIFADQPLKYEPVAYYVEDPTNPDAPVFSPDEGYFDITNKLFVTPELLESPYGTYPACFFSPDYPGGQYPIGNCNSTEVKVRLSFRQVTDRDYAPVNWDGVRMDMFGMFTSGTITPSVFGYDRKYGLVDEKWYRFASRLNIWQGSHARGGDGQKIACYTEATTPAGADPNRDIAPFNGTDDECESAGAGSRCDRYTHACTTPYRSRQTAVVPYFYGPDSDPTLFETVSKALGQWDEALRHAAQTARYTECIRVSQQAAAPTQAEIDQCKQEFPPSLEGALAAVPEILTLCHNPVLEGDHPECGPIGTKARVGDLRFHMANVIQNPQVPSPWGILADAVDPLTGEVVAASVNVWNAVTDVAAQTMVDQMRWYLGELATDDVISANYLADWVGAERRSQRALPAGGPPLLSPAQIDPRLQAMDRSLAGTDKPTLPAGINQRGLIDWASDQVRLTFGDQVLGSGNSGREARLAMARESEVETALLTGPYVAMAGLDPALPVDSTALNAASPLRGNMASFRLDLERQRHIQLALSGRCMLEAPEPASVIDLARIMDEKFPIVPNADGGVGAAEILARNQKWHDFLRKQLTYGVMEHELGHSMGLRHVFTSSYDALNFRPQYWQLRSRDGAETDVCTGPTDDGSECIGPRYYDPITQAERDGLIWMWHQTSVMEYPGDIAQESLGIGAYDRAAIRFAYADVADVWDEPETVSCTSIGSQRACTEPADVLQSLIDTSFGGIGGPWYGAFTQADAFHYSELQNRFALVRNCQPADTSPPADWNEEENGAYHPVFDGQIVNGTVCEEPPVDYVSYTEMQLEQPGFAQQYGIFGGAVRKYDPLGRVRRPYMFGSDEYADIGNVAVLRNDNGADPYEIVHFLVAEYEDRHIWDNFRRNRTSFALRPAYMRGFTRYNSKLLHIGKSIGLYNELFQGTAIFDDLTIAPDSPYGSVDGLLKPAALASSMIFDHFARMLTRPMTGPHFADTGSDPAGRVLLRSTDQAFEADGPGAGNWSIIVPEGSTGIGGDVAWGGRPVNNAYDRSKGYYALQYDAYVGSYYDKTIAIDLLTESVDRFVDASRDDFVDGRYRNVSFASLFPDGMRRLLATALTEDNAMLGWRVSSTGGDPNVTEDTFVPLQPLGFKSWWPSAGPQTCWPFQGRVACTAWPSEEPLDPSVPAESLPIDPELGFEVQKFIIFYALLNLPDNWKTDWVDLMRIYKVGFDVDPQLQDQIAWVDPVSAQAYIAHRYGPEVIEGQTVERGIAGRMISWMNTLTKQAYDVATEDPLTGELTYNKHVDDSACPSGVTYCAGDPIVIDPRFAIRVKNYKTLLDFMHTVVSRFGFGRPDLRGVAD